MSNERKTNLDWKRILAEVAIIVASILLALAVDEWRHGQQDRKLESEYLERLNADLVDNLDILERQKMQESSQIKHARLIYPLISHGEWGDLDQFTAVVASYEASPSATPVWVDYTFEELKSTGRLGLVRSAEIRTEILSYYRHLRTRDYTYELMSTAYRDAIRSKMEPDLQLKIRACRSRGNCTFDMQPYHTEEYLDWLTNNRELAEGLRRVIVQWTRGEMEYLPIVKEHTQSLLDKIEMELTK
jgi:hypothetical protein